MLRQIKVRNLNTGREVDLAEAEDRLPTHTNPLSLQIMRLTSEYVRYVGCISFVKSVAGLLIENTFFLKKP